MLWWVSPVLQSYILLLYHLNFCLYLITEKMGKSVDRFGVDSFIVLNGSTFIIRKYEENKSPLPPS